MDNINKFRVFISDSKAWAIPNIRNLVTNEEWQPVADCIHKLELALDDLKAANEPIYTGENSNELTEILDDLEG